MEPRAEDDFFISSKCWSNFLASTIFLIQVFYFYFFIYLLINYNRNFIEELKILSIYFIHVYSSNARLEEMRARIWIMGVIKYMQLERNLSCEYCILVWNACMHARTRRLKCDIFKISMQHVSISDLNEWKSLPVKTNLCQKSIIL